MQTHIIQKRAVLHIEGQPRNLYVSEFTLRQRIMRSSRLQRD